jgi:sterol desaturase/sphingolipid hydroxylase (fatty acid hydroxylase superfamily)
MDSTYQTIIVSVLAGAVLLLLVLERLLPLRRRVHASAPRIVSNLVITALSFAVAAVTVTPTVVYLSTWTTAHQFGLVHALDLPPWLQVLAAFLLMDVSFYWWHRLNHTVPLLWRFHKVHHVDPDMDVTTSFRFHAVEVAVSTGFRALQIGLIGPSILALALYQGVFQASTVFHHSNLRLPIRFEGFLNTVLVTPRMHGIHHSQVIDESNANYGVVFRFWDWLHRSLRMDVPQARITIGVAGYGEPEDNRILPLLIMPFTTPRERGASPPVS